MTILQALTGYYDRMAARGEVPPEGYSSQPIDFRLVIRPDGSVFDVVDLRYPDGKRLKRQMLAVPNPQRTSNVMPNFLWDKTAYLFGVTAGPDHRTAQEHATFVAEHRKRLSNVSDPKLIAFVRFLESWTAQRFADPPFNEEMKDKNFVVSVLGETEYVHDSDEAKAMLADSGSRTLPSQLCLVTGEYQPVAELHPVIKNVRGGQSSGGYLVSFNATAFTSWNAKDGANAPTSAKATARYGAALNELLLSNANRLQIGDATVAFWADTAGIDERRAHAAEQAMAAIFGTAAKVDRDQDTAEASKVRAVLADVAKGRAAPLDGVDVVPGTEVHILGLSPNAARLSVRFWLTERLEVFARNLTLHEEHCRIEPLPRGWGAEPSINVLLVRTAAAQEKWDNIPPLLAGEVSRAVLGGAAYPRMLLSNAIMRLRAGDDPTSGWHAAAMRAVLVRERFFRQQSADHQLEGEETPVSLNPTYKNVGYQLGRLFAVYELAQRAALGTKLNRTIRDSYFGAAMSTPITVFPTIIANGQNHLGKVRRDKPGWAVLIERELEQISDTLDPTTAPTIPKTLKQEDQAEFAIGYYHQRRAKLGKSEEPQLSFDDEIATPDEEAQ